MTPCCSSLLTSLARGAADTATPITPYAIGSTRAYAPELGGACPMGGWDDGGIGGGGASGGVIPGG